MKKILTVLVLVSAFLPILAQGTVVSFTLEDRDRIIRTEQEIKSLRNEMNSLRNEMNAKFESMDTKFESMDTKFESQQMQISDLKTMFVWGFGVLVSLMLFTLGFVIWDRRTALNPVQKTTISLKEKVKNIENILKKEAASNKRLAEILRTYGLL